MGLLDRFYAAAEPALGLLSGAVAEPVAGWAGLLSGGSKQAVEGARNALTYQPRTAAGKAGQNALANALLGIKTAMVDNNPPVRMAVEGYNELADRAGLLSPALGAAVKTAPVALGLFAGPGSAQTRQAFAHVAGDTAKALGPKFGEMTEQYMFKTGGALPIFAGEKSTAAPIWKLEFAKQLEGAGVPDREIHKRTGWTNRFPGAGWVFETSDNMARLTGYNPTDMALEKYRTGGLDAMREFREASKGYKQPAYRPSLQTVEDVLDHPVLLDQYPQLRDMLYLHQPDNPIIGEGAVGTYHGRPIMVTSPANDKTLRSVMIHELQHAVQDIEGMPGGGGAAVAANRGDAAAYDQY